MKKFNLNYFIYGTATKEDYDLITEERDSFNHKVWKIVSALMSIYFFVLFLTTFSVEVVHPNTVTDAILFLISLISLGCLLTFAKPGNQWLMPVIYLTSLGLLGFGVMLGAVLSPEYLAVTFHVLLVGLPLIVADKPWKMSFLEILMSLLFIWACYIYKTAETRALDVYNAVAFALLAQIVNYYIVRTKMQQFLTARKISVSSITDDLTGLYNRKAYEMDMLELRDSKPKKDFVYAAMDVNGLKKVNDQLGHDAGDELLKGASSCISRCFGSYGKAYRTGGDEFIVMFYADETRLQAIMKDFDETLEHWSGIHVSSFSVSAGYVRISDYPELSMHEISKMADQRMYNQKSEFYKKKGVDRRAKQVAHTAICNLYSKILKINLTNDTYEIISMDFEEQTETKGFSSSISEWMKSFGLSGHVHPDDLPEYLSKTDFSYLKQYFKSNKNSIMIFYRRKYGETYKQTIMEMIPANDYSDGDQNLFLYVKCIDK